MAKTSLSKSGKLRKLIPIFIFCLSTFLFTLVGDQFLGLIGYPSFQYSHPANFNKPRKNIEYETEFRTNSQGLRYKEIPLNKPNGERRILVLGDSFVEGEGVEGDETFSHLLERHFSKTLKRATPFINGGLEGTGPLQHWRMYYRVGLKYNPDGIIISIYANDVSDTPEFLNYSFSRRIIDSLSEKISNSFISVDGFHEKEFGVKKIFHFLLPRTYMIIKNYMRKNIGTSSSNDFVTTVIQEARSRGIQENIIRQWKDSLDQQLVVASNKGEFNKHILSSPLLDPTKWVDGIDIDTPRAKRKYKSMITILDKIADISHTRGIEVALVYIPVRYHYDPGAYDPQHPFVKAGMVREYWLHEKAIISKRLEQWARPRRIPFKDLTNAFRDEIKNGSSLNFRLDGHWNVKRHQVAADILAKWIEKDNVFSFLR